MAKKNKKNKKFNVSSVISGLKIDSGRSRTLHSGVVPYGENNTYPNDVFEATRLSPTAKGCVKRLLEYIFGKGIIGGNDVIVNRKGETLNQVFRVATWQYSWLRAYSLHFNFNLFGEITEISNVDIRFIRKTQNLLKARIDIYNKNSAIFATGEKVEIFLYDPDNFKYHVKEDEGINNFKGNIYYFTENNNIYSLASGDASLPSAQFESESQVYNIANINNSFNASGLLKIPYKQNNEEYVKEIKSELAKMKGAGNAGGIIVMEVPPNIDGNTNNISVFEKFEQNNIDKMYVEQNKQAENNILKEYNMPKILLGISDNGMFNQASFQDASDYFNSNTAGGRSVMEASFNKFWSNTIFSNELNNIEIEPLPFFNKPEDTNGSTSNNDTGS